jgi:hypothetical protein
MILLCHAILIALLGNAGLLTNNDKSQSHTNRNAAPLAAVDDHAWWPSTEPERLLHVATREVILEEKQGTWRTGNACLIHGRHLVAAAAAELQHQPDVTAPEGNTVSPMDSDDDCVLVANQSRNGAGEEAPPEEELLLPEQYGEEEDEEEEEDLDEMNRRFEAFIATTKEKMRLEALHPSPQNRRALLA